MEGGSISEQHGTAEREVGGIGTDVTSGNVSAGSGGNSFEEVPPRYESPPGLSERQRAISNGRIKFQFHLFHQIMEMTMRRRRRWRC